MSRPRTKYDSRPLAKALRPLRHLAEYLLVRVLLSLIQAVSIETCAVASKVVAWLACDVLRIRRQVVDENLRFSFPELSAADRRQLAREMWEHLLLMVCEVAHVHRKLHETNWREHVADYNTRELLKHAFARRATVAVAGHFGNFEICGFMAGFWGVRVYTIARPLDNPYLDHLITQFRQSMGQRILPKEDSAGQADEVLKTGGMLVLLGDQHAGHIGCVVDFLGRPASCHKALALFSLINQAPMLLVNCTRAGRPMQFRMGLDACADPLENRPETAGVRELTQWYNHKLEEQIRRRPQQYWWLHNRWKEITGKRPRKKKASVPVPPANQIRRPAA
jgi:KDO2-lipid IV(A) lauroyltransferase